MTNGSLLFCPQGLVVQWPPECALYQQLHMIVKWLMRVVRECIYIFGEEGRGWLMTRSTYNQDGINFIREGGGGL